MKKGKNVKLKLFNTIKSAYGTVDCKDLKSVYVNVQSWVTPKKEFNNWNRVVCNLSRSIKHSVYNSINEDLFKKNTIVDLDLRTSGIQFGKKSFFNLEINLYLIEPLEFKSQELKTEVKKIISNIFLENIISNRYFDFSTTKEHPNSELFTNTLVNKHT